MGKLLFLPPPPQEEGFQVEALLSRLSLQQAKIYPGGDEARGTQAKSEAQIYKSGQGAAAATYL